MKLLILVLLISVTLLSCTWQSTEYSNATIAKEEQKQTEIMKEHTKVMKEQTDALIRIADAITPQKVREPLKK